MFKILLAEDDANLRKLLCKHLELAGYEIASFENGQQALDAFFDESFDLLLTDIMMPEMDGNQLTKEIKKIKKDFPVIIITALDTIDDKKTGYGSGAAL